MSDDSFRLSVKEASRVTPRLGLISVKFDEISGGFLTVKRPSGSLNFQQSRAHFTVVRLEGAMVAFLEVSFSIWIEESESTRSPMAEMAFRLRLDYRTEDGELTDDELLHFAGISGFMHAFPYIRAEVQTLTAKLGLPPLTLPPMLSGSVGDQVTIDLEVRRPASLDAGEE